MVTAGELNQVLNTRSSRRSARAGDARFATWLNVDCRCQRAKAKAVCSAANMAASNAVLARTPAALTKRRSTDEEDRGPAKEFEAEFEPWKSSAR